MNRSREPGRNIIFTIPPPLLRLRIADVAAGSHVQAMERGSSVPAQTTATRHFTAVRTTTNTGTVAPTTTAIVEVQMVNCPGNKPGFVKVCSGNNVTSDDTSYRDFQACRNKLCKISPFYYTVAETQAIVVYQIFMFLVQFEVFLWSYILRVSSACHQTRMFFISSL